MREIKFRGKRVDNGKWIYGGYFFDEELNKFYIIIDFIMSEYFEVISKTVGQYTGLKDKNGVEIYEGDNGIYYHKPKNKIIRYKGNITLDYVWGIDLNLDNRCKWWKHEMDGILTNFEVTGNIHDNLELLEVYDTNFI